MRHYGVRNSVSVLRFKLRHRHDAHYECPICGYTGPFMEYTPPDGPRKHARCPNCSALERHRIQFVVVKEVLNDRKTDHLNMLHFAPEPFFREFFLGRFGRYETADLKLQGVDHVVDLQRLPFADGTYDFVFASHVLEHISDDHKALAEIRRILRPGGIAILPVPIVEAQTIEYPEPNPHEFGHVRAPGPDYFDRYERHFSKVERFSSDQLPEQYQLFIYEDRSHLPTKEYPLRTPMLGKRFSDYVPVCYV